MFEDSISSRGGARIGWMNATWPFAVLTARQAKLDLNATLLGKYSFTPDQVISLEKYGSIPILGSGIRIHHNIADYSKKIVFWCFGSPQKLIKRIEDTGFLPSAQPDSLPPERGMPIRWQVIIAIIVLWNFLFLLDMFSPSGSKQEPGAFSLLAVFLLFLGSIGIWRIRTLQNIILKPGRSPNEIKPWLYLLAFISGIMSIFMLISIFNQPERSGSHINYTKINEFNSPFEIVSGRTIVPGTWDWDIESDVIGGEGQIDIWWKYVNTKERSLVPRNGAKFALISELAYEDIDIQHLKSLKYYDKEISDSEDKQVLLKGTTIGVLTAEENLAKLKVLGFRELHDFQFEGSEVLDQEWRSFVLKKRNREKYHIEFAWTLYQKAQ